MKIDFEMQIEVDFDMQIEVACVYNDYLVTLLNRHVAILCKSTEIFYFKAKTGKTFGFVFTIL